MGAFYWASIGWTKVSAAMRCVRRCDATPVAAALAADVLLWPSRRYRPAAATCVIQPLRLRPATPAATPPATAAPAAAPPAVAPPAAAPPAVAALAAVAPAAAAPAAVVLLRPSCRWHSN